MSSQEHNGPVWYGRQRPPHREWGGRLPVALVFPAPARVGLATLGWQVVHRLLWPQPGLAVERFFWEGGAEPPRAYDTDTPLSAFPVIAFSLNVEDEVRGLAEVLLRGGVPLQRRDRPDWPLVMAGGPLCFLNPAPAAPAVDIFFVGEAEHGLVELLGVCEDYALSGRSKTEFLEAVRNRPGVYAPGLTDREPGGRAVRAVAGNGTGFDPASSCFVSPEAEFRDMFLLEVNRGCPHGCRFCAAGYIYRPPRQAALADLQRAVDEARPRKVGLVGTALTDWPDLMEFLRWLHARKIAFSLSSMRADGLTMELLTFLRKAGVRSLTLALEGASTRLRRAVNKRLDEDAFLTAVERIAALQFNHLKIYCIVGWPDEGPEDYEELARFLGRMRQAMDAGRGGRKAGIGHVTLSASCLVPKPWTPFQWAPMASEEQLTASLARVRTLAKAMPGFRFRGESPFAARLQGLLARGGEDVFELVRLAAEEDLSWRAALNAWRERGGDPAAILDRERGRDEAFPWECIDLGLDREFLYREWERYAQAQASAPCPALSRENGCGDCVRCGVGAWLNRA